MRVGTYANALSVPGAVRIPERTERTYAQRARESLVRTLKSTGESTYSFLVRHFYGVSQEYRDAKLNEATQYAENGNLVGVLGILEDSDLKGAYISLQEASRLRRTATVNYLIDMMRQHNGPDLEGLMLFKEICQGLASDLGTTLEAIWEKESRRRQSLSSQDKSEVAV